MDAAHNRTTLSCAFRQIDQIGSDIGRTEKDLNLIKSQRLYPQHFRQEAETRQMDEWRQSISDCTRNIRETRELLKDARLYASVDKTARGKFQKDMQSRLEGLRDKTRKLEGRLSHAPDGFKLQRQADKFFDKAFALNGDNGHPDEQTLKSLRKEISELLAGHPELPLGFQSELVGKLRQIEEILAAVHSKALPKERPDLGRIIFQQIEYIDLEVSSEDDCMQVAENPSQPHPEEYTPEAIAKTMKNHRERVAELTKSIRENRELLKNGKLFECVDRTARAKFQKDLQARVEKQRGEVRRLEGRITKLPEYFDLNRRADAVFTKCENVKEQILGSAAPDQKKLKELHKEMSQFLAQSPQLSLSIQIEFSEILELIKSRLVEAAKPPKEVWTRKELKLEVLKRAEQDPQAALTRARTVVKGLEAIATQKDAKKRQEKMVVLFTQEERHALYRIIGVEKGEKPHIPVAVDYGRKYFGKEFRFVQRIAIDNLWALESQNRAKS